MRSPWTHHCREPGHTSLRCEGGSCSWYAGALALGCSEASVAAALANLELPGGRYERTSLGDVDVIFDAYNASMAGTLATLDAFGAERARRRIAVLASMAELGESSAAMHERVGAAAARADLSALLVGGAFASDLERGARAAGIPAERLVRFEQNADAVRWLADNARAGDLVLLKGSRMYHLEEVVEGMRRHHGR
jgi:UDP-N-acetylmuramoyl-tripeptide--D-alanyl-D-alanine ligase